MSLPYENLPHRATTANGRQGYTSLVKEERKGVIVKNLSANRMIFNPQFDCIR